MVCSPPCVPSKWCCLEVAVRRCLEVRCGLAPLALPLIDACCWRLAIPVAMRTVGAGGAEAQSHFPPPARRDTAQRLICHQQLQQQELPRNYRELPGNWFQFCVLSPPAAFVIRTRQQHLCMWRLCGSSSLGTGRQQLFGGGARTAAGRQQEMGDGSGASQL